MPKHLIDQGVEKKFQTRESTSESAKFIGELIDYSPAKLENYLRGYFGGLGRHITDITDKAVIKIKDIELPVEPERGLTNWPLLKGFLAKNPSSGMRSIEKFWDEWEKINGAYNTHRYLLKTNEEEAQKYKIEHDLLLTQYDDYKELRKIMSAMNKEIKNIYNDTGMTALEKRQKINKIYHEMADLAKGFRND